MFGILKLHSDLHFRELQNFQMSAFSQLCKKIVIFMDVFCQSLRTALFGSSRAMILIFEPFKCTMFRYLPFGYEICMEHRLHKINICNIVQCAHKHNLGTLNYVYGHKNKHKHSLCAHKLSFCSFLCKRHRSHCSETNLNNTQIKGCVQW